MASAANNGSTFNLVLNLEVKELVEQAALQLGTTASDFALASLAEAARNVLEHPPVTVLSDRDRDIFCALLDDADAEPNEALKEAARRYKEELG